MASLYARLGAIAKMNKKQAVNQGKQHMNDMGYGSGRERDQRYLAPVPQLLDSGKKEKE